MAFFPLVASSQATVDEMNILGYTVEKQMDILNRRIEMPAEMKGGPEVADNYNAESFYSDGFGGGGTGPIGGVITTIAPQPASVAPTIVVISMAMLTRALGSSALARQAFNILRGLIQGTTRTGVNVWTSIPAWIRVALTSIGIPAGVSIAMSDEDEIPGPGDIARFGPELTTRGDGTISIVPIPGGQLVLENGVPANFVTTWWANGVRFYRLVDGRMAVQNLKGTWKVWKPKKPVVIMPGGVSDLKSLLRADRIIDRQSKQLDKMLSRRTRRSTRGVACVSCGLVRGHRASCPVAVTIK